MNEQENPWQTLSSENIYENPWISVREDQVINPSGGRGIYGVITFKNIAVGVVPIDDEGFTYLVGQYRYALNEYSWEIPEGGCPIGVELLDAAKRELKEETGLSAQDWTYIMRLHTSNSVCDEVAHVYIAENLVAGETDWDETEQLAVRRLPLTDAIRMAVNGEITDGISLAALLKVAQIKGISI